MSIGPARRRAADLRCFEKHAPSGATALTICRERSQSHATIRPHVVQAALGRVRSRCRRPRRQPGVLHLQPASLAVLAVPHVRGCCSDQRTFETLALVGEPVDGGEIWFEGQGYLSDAISPMIINSAFGGRRARPGMNGLDERLRDTYEFYEHRRRQGLSSAPPLRRLQLYRFSWTLRPDLANLRTPRRTLIASYPSDDRPAR